MEPLEPIILAVLEQVAAQQKRSLPPLASGQSLTADLGFKSLDLAQIVALLEVKLRADPFAKLIPITSVRTVGDLCAAYRAFFAGSAPAGSTVDLGPGQDRGRARQQAEPQSARSVRESLRES